MTSIICAKQWKKGARVFIVSADFPIATFDEEFRDLSEQLAAGGEILATIPRRKPPIRED